MQRDNAGHVPRVAVGELRLQLFRHQIHLGLRLFGRDSRLQPRNRTELMNTAETKLIGAKRDRHKQVALRRERKSKSRWQHAHDDKRLTVHI